MKLAYAIATLAGLTLSSAAFGQWTGASLTDGDVRFQVPSGSTGAGALNSAVTTGASSISADFRTTGAAGTDHTFTNWWWYRTSINTRENAIASPAGSSAVAKSLTGTSGVSYSGIQPETTGGNSGLRFTLGFSVQDLDGPGGNRGVVATTLTVTNTGTTPVDGMTMFHYFDYFFTGEDAGDQCLPGNSGVAFGPFRRYIIITDATDATVPSFGELLHEGLGADAYTAGSFSVVGGQMGDSGIDNFSDLNSATVAGDQSGIMQWNFGTIAPGGTASATATATIIPTPGAAALLGLGGLIVGRRRR